jgi:DNA replication and repair protein RecF
MYLQRLRLINFKNYDEVEIELSPSVNCFTGLNGSGKTNLLDAIHYLSMTRSYFQSSDLLNIRHSEQSFFIQGDFNREGLQESVFCSVKQGQKKQFKRNQFEYDRLSEHIGAFPVVMIAPTDQELITEGSDMRRRFMDSIISQYDHEYLEALIRYNQVIQQRNSLLKQASTRGFIDWTSLSVWDEQLCAYGEKIFSKRNEFVAGFQPLFNELFSYIAGSSEEATIQYESQLHSQNFEVLLKNSGSKDLDLQYTSCGIHKDDLIFRIKGVSAKKFGSQGQQKSFVIALKLAHFKYLCNLGFSKPVILLDDIFDKLDDNRVSRLMEWINRDGFGQLFITDAHKDRVATIFNNLNIPFRHFTVVNDTVVEELVKEES